MTSWLKELLGGNPKDPIQEKYADYLIHWRLSLWNSIRHKELLIWTFIGFYATANGIILGPGRQYISPLTEIFIVSLLSLLGMHVVLDANVWNARNLFTVSRIERLFIGTQRGILIPPYYLAPAFRFNTIYTIHLTFISSLALLSYLRYTWRYLRWPCCAISTARELGELLVATLVLLALFILIYRFGNHYRNSYFDFRRGFDKETDGTPLPEPTAAEQQDAALRDPTWILSQTGTSLALTGLDFALATNVPWGLTLITSTLLLVAVVSNIFLQWRSWIAQPLFASPGKFRRFNIILLIGTALISLGYSGLNHQMFVSAWRLLVS